MIECVGRTVEETVRYFTGHFTRAKKASSFQAPLVRYTTPSDAESLSLPQTYIPVNDNYGEFELTDEKDKIFVSREFTLHEGLQSHIFEISTNISASQPESDTLSNQIIAIRQTYARIADLKKFAIDEGMGVSMASEKDFKSFLASVEFTRRPYIALLDNGNFRAVWKNADREQIGLQFRGGGLIHYVFFALRSPGRFMAQAAGKDTLQNTRRQIDVLGLGRLMTE